MTRKQAYILTALIVFIIGGVVFAVVNRKNKETGGNLPSEKNQASNSPTAEAKKYYTAEVPENAKLTKPAQEFPSSPGKTEKKIRIFDMKVSKDGFSPNNLVVNRGDTIQINMTALDGDYDFSMPVGHFYQFSKIGETKNITFDATLDGTFVFECRDHCPTGKVIKGKIVVLP